MARRAQGYPLSELTSAQAVYTAVDEFDRLGRERFLAKYKFGRAREYFVRRNERLYDSKAIAGAAYGYQFPERGALSASDFSGGEATVQTKLESLGVEVVRLSERATERSSTSISRELVRAFDARLLEAYREAKNIGYNAQRFIGMLSERGGIETARMLLNNSGVSDGYVALWERGRLDLTVEAVILEPQWSQIFTRAERRIAITRLRDYQYTGSLPPS